MTNEQYEVLKSYLNSHPELGELSHEEVARRLNEDKADTGLDNVGLRVDGIPLILPPRRRSWPGIALAAASYSRRTTHSPRTSTREAVL
ncbi:MAG: hypothetical protein KatS3mg087_2082 [Patescibacteria group bacterium]|nr:MAG: hypothetical protein KatS3mg087_2082 [Patescibacteria group bacterium]